MYITEYPYAGAYVGGAQAPPRLTRVPGIAGPNPPIPGAPNVSSTV